MKKTMISALALSIALGVGAGYAHGSGGMGPRALPSFEDLDRDASGGITMDDLSAFAEARRADPMPQIRAKLMEHAGEDGLLSEDELRDGMAALRDDMTRRLRGDAERDRAEMGQRMFDRVDANDDGVVDAEEYAAFTDRMAEPMEKRGKRGWGRN